jgi:hypothetical protein
MAFRRPLFLIEDLSSFLTFESSCMSVWAPTLSEAQPITPRLINRQTERVNQIIEDMLRDCVLTDGPKWDKHLPLAEFSYNNSYQESIKMSPFKELYGRPYRTLLSCSESGERVIFSRDIVAEAEEKVKQIQASILTAQSHQKSYADKRHRP